VKAIQLTPVQQHTAVHPEAPYRAFIGGSLALGIGGGFLLALLISLARALEWGWGSGARYPAYVQAHGQLQLVGFVGLFIMGMAMRLLPRIAGRDLAFAALAPWLLVTIIVSLILRAVSEPAGDGIFRDAGLWASAALLLAAGAVFAAIIFGTGAGRGAQFTATGAFFMLGAIGFVAGAAINVFQVHETVRDSLAAAPSSKQVGLVLAQQYGFTLMFIGGIASRAVPNFTGRKRRENIALACAGTLATGALLAAGASLWAAYRGGSETWARVEDAGLILTAVAFVLLVWISGALWPGPNRVAAASQTQFWFVRAAMAWLLVAAALTLWYAVPAFGDGRFVDQFEMDAVRHTITIGLLTMLIIGMAMLIVPEFAGRRLQHPDERWIVVGMLVALNLAVVLRVWPPTQGIDWIQHTRFWPMAIAGGLAEAVVIAFGLMFAQSYVEQRHPGWATPQAISARRGGRPAPHVQEKQT
jgi:hypothetical protein